MRKECVAILLPRGHAAYRAERRTRITNNSAFTRSKTCLGSIITDINIEYYSQQSKPLSHSQRKNVVFIENILEQMGPSRNSVVKKRLPHHPHLRNLDLWEKWASVCVPSLLDKVETDQAGVEPDEKMDINPDRESIFEKSDQYETMTGEENLQVIPK
ncbi:hypothetical protein TNCV_3625691 [Trichonephila clavipes]|nr:hypothetical protein TNCV_3625691 [Trichonephila clavipes]